MAEFDPSKPFTTDEPKPQEFDPSKPFESGEALKPEKSSLQSIAESLGRVKGMGALGFAMNPAVQDGARRALGYLAGGARTLVAAPFGGVTKENAVQALKGEAPGLSKYLEQSGVPNGPNVPLTSISARDVGGFVGDLALDPLMYLNPAASLEGKAGKIAAAASGSEVNAASRGLGKYLYKSGLKKVDDEVAKYGKAPVSDILMKERVTGSARSIAERMDELASDRLARRDQILSTATQAGAETNMNRSLEPAQEFINGVKAQKDPRLNPVINRMQNEVDTLKTVAAREAKTEFVPRPGVDAYNAETLSKRLPDGKADLYWREAGENARGKGVVGEPVLNNPEDSIVNLPVAGEYKTIPREAGPNPEQMTAMKSNSYSVIGDQGYNDAKATPLWKRFEKVVAKGQKDEVERSVGETLGPLAEKTLAQHNDELGRLLTSQEKAEQAARVAGNKNAFTSVDAMIAGSHSEGGLVGMLTSPMLALKKIADVTKESRFRTNGGLFLDDLGQTQIPAALYRRQLRKENSWENVK